MAKKRKGRKSSKRRGRRKMSGDQSLAPAVVSGRGRKGKRKTGRKKMGATDTGSNVGKTILSALGGAAVSLIVDKYVPVNGKVKSAVLVLAGAGTAYYGYKKKNNAVIGAGVGLAVGGGLSAAKEFGLIQGMDEFMRGMGLAKEDTMLIEMSGDPTMIKGDQTLAPAVVSGEEDTLSGTTNNMPSVISGY